LRKRPWPRRWPRLAAFLVENGVRYAFGVGGHGNTPLVEAIAAHAAAALQ